jgi:hypothetical protein
MQSPHVSALRLARQFLIYLAQIRQQNHGDNLDMQQVSKDKTNAVMNFPGAIDMHGNK